MDIDNEAGFKQMAELMRDADNACPRKYTSSDYREQELRALALGREMHEKFIAAGATQISADEYVLECSESQRYEEMNTLKALFGIDVTPVPIDESLETDLSDEEKTEVALLREDLLTLEEMIARGQPGSMPYAIKFWESRSRSLETAIRLVKQEIGDIYNRHWCSVCGSAPWEKCTEACDDPAGECEDACLPAREFEDIETVGAVQIRNGEMIEIKGSVRFDGEIPRSVAEHVNNLTRRSSTSGYDAILATLKLESSRVHIDNGGEK